MATVITDLISTKVLNSLDTYNHTAKAASMYYVSIQLNEVPPSGISIVIKQNSSTIASLSSPAASQSVMNLQAVLNCALNDVIGVVISSSSAIDQGPNAFKAILNIHQGSF